MKCVSVVGVAEGDGVVVGCVPFVAVNSTLGGVVEVVEADIALHSTAPCWWRSFRCGSLSAPAPGSPMFCMIAGWRCI